MHWTLVLNHDAEVAIGEEGSLIQLGKTDHANSYLYQNSSRSVTF